MVYQVDSVIYSNFNYQECSKSHVIAGVTCNNIKKQNDLCTMDGFQIRNIKLIILLEDEQYSAMSINAIRLDGQ